MCCDEERTRRADTNSTNATLHTIRFMLLYEVESSFIINLRAVQNTRTEPVGL